MESLESVMAATATAAAFTRGGGQLPRYSGKNKKHNE